MLWCAVRGSRNGLRTQPLPLLCRIGRLPQGVDILSTEQQHFVLSRRFSLDRIFAVVYIASSDSGGTWFGERTAHSPRQHRITIARNLSSSIATSRGYPSTLYRRRSQRCWHGVAQDRRQSSGANGMRKWSCFLLMIRNSWCIHSNTAIAC